MRGFSFGVLFVLAVFVVFSVGAGSQASSDYELSGSSVYTEVAGKGRVSQTPHTVASGEWLVINATNYFSSTNQLDIGFGLNDNLVELKQLELLQAQQYQKQVANCTSQTVNHGNGTVEQVQSCTYTNVNFSVDKWVSVMDSLASLNYDGGKLSYVRLQGLQQGGSALLRAKLGAKANFVGVVKYDILLKPSADVIGSVNDVLLDPWLNLSSYGNDFNDGSDLNSSANTARQVDGVLLLDFNATVWDVFGDREYRNNPQWDNVTAATATGVEVKFTPENFFSWSSTGSTAGDYLVFYPGDGRNNFSVSQDASGTMASAWFRSQGTNSRGPVIGVRIDWNEAGPADSNPFTSSTGDSLYCLAGPDNVLYILQSNDGSVTVKANPAYTGGTTSGKWYNMSLHFNKTHVRCGIGHSGDNPGANWVAHDLSNLESARAYFGLYAAGGAEWFNMTNVTIANESQLSFANATFKTKILNSTAQVGKVNLSMNYYSNPAETSTSCQVFDGNHENTQSVTVGTETTLSPALTGIGFSCTLTTVNTGKTMAINYVNLSITQGESTAANEADGDNAIETAINSSVPSAAKYKTQQVYVVNSSNAQKQGTVDYLVIQNSPQRRWLINYITAGESYLSSTNLSSTVYVLEITDKTVNDIIQEVSTFINSTKS